MFLSASVRVCGTHNNRSRRRRRRHRFWSISSRLHCSYPTTIGTSFHVVFVRVAHDGPEKDLSTSHLGPGSARYGWRRTVVYGVNVKLINWHCVLLLKRTHCTDVYDSQTGSTTDLGRHCSVGRRRKRSRRPRFRKSLLGTRSDRTCTTYLDKI